MSRGRSKRISKGNPKSCDDFKVGFGKPPREHQFKKGQSGNPKGRPPRKKAKPIIHYNEPFKDIVLNEAYRKVSILEGEKPVKISLAEACMRSIMVNAANGNLQCQKLFVQLIGTIEKQDRLEKEAAFQSALEFKEIYSDLIDKSKRDGQPEPDIVPHPDHIHLDFMTSEFSIKGPVTTEQKKICDAMKARRSEALAEIRAAQEMLMSAKDPRERAVYQSNIDSEMAILAIFKKYFGDET